jgi:predicted small secreted protein
MQPTLLGRRKEDMRRVPSRAEREVLIEGLEIVRSESDGMKFHCHPHPRLRGAGRSERANFERQHMKQNLLNRTCQMLGILSVFALVIGLFSLTGCNTWKGAGKDIERTGEAMQGKD